ncbi:endonuclease MutS2 [Hoylesella shahii]|uniref:endonuclease MutS2 n=1 Tax=Hoylesella shahii TaxID=228603 RepID=UPI001CACF337|nr:Smr/MutS family protein [Hoylesella shahii]MBF1575397.1 Smr/MutS family protein [Hoylesella shahii]
MIYPNNFEQKIGFNEVRTLLKSKCLSTLGTGLVDDMVMSDDANAIQTWLKQTREFRLLQTEADDFPLQYFFELRPTLSRLRIEGTHLDEQELFDLFRSLDTIHLVTRFLNRTTNGEDATDGENAHFLYPTLQRLTVDVITFPDIVRRIGQIVDKFGKIKDSASPELARIRRELAQTEGSVSRILNNILRNAQQEGLVEKDVTPAIREGRLVIPVLPGMKRKIGGIVHDESASGRTVYIEPTEVVEANNKIRELEADEKKEIVRILKEVSADIRPHITPMMASYQLLAHIDFIRAKAELARTFKAIEPQLNNSPLIDWGQAVHPLLKLSLEKQGKHVVPLDVILTKDKRILIISGPNAGGKSVCLKTVGLLQYMVQCGLSVPMGDTSRVGVFQNLMIDIGDEQSIENDLSTYSSHLLNMKMMMKNANDKTLILIDEFGTGTEPQIGGAIAESVLTQFCKKGTFGVVTTHYQNLKHFADNHKGVANGAMLYDRKEMRALFMLSIGQPGSSFAIEIARKIGLPEEVIQDASRIVGEDYIQSDKYLQDIVRDKRYWENKRATIHKQEKDLQAVIERYEKDIEEIGKTRKDVLKRAKEQAEELLRESNKRIETTIREIKEAQAEKERTKRIREELSEFRTSVEQVDASAYDEFIAKKIEQIKRRKERHEKHIKEKAEKQKKAAEQIREAVSKKSTPTDVIMPGNSVKMKGLTTVGRVESLDSNGKAMVVFGGIRSKIDVKRLELATPTQKEQTKQYSISKETRQAIDDRKNNFHQDLDVRGERGDEALNAVMHFIDDAILVGMPRVRILHGKGNGILRQLIRQYLATVPNVTAFKDEHVQFGGAGITVVDL